MANACPTSVKSNVTMQKWVCGTAHPIGCVEHNGLYYFNLVADNIADPSIGVGQGSYAGGFTLCGMMTYMANLAIDEYHDEEYDAMVKDFFSCLSAHKSATNYKLGDVVVSNGVIYESLKDDNLDAVTVATSWESYNTPCTILTSMKINEDGVAVLGVDCEGTEVAAGAAITTCVDLANAVMVLNTRITAEVATLNTRISNEVAALEAADMVLQTNIDLEAAARADADAVETAARIAADDLEKAEREAADDVEKAERIAGDAALQTEVDANEAAITALDDAKQDKLKRCDGSDVAGGLQIPSCDELQEEVTDLKAIITDEVQTLNASIATEAGLRAVEDANIQTQTTENENDIQTLRDTKQDQLLNCAGDPVAGQTRMATCNEMQLLDNALQTQITQNDTDIAATQAVTTGLEVNKQDALLGCDGTTLDGGLNIPTCQEMTAADEALGIRIDEVASDDAKQDVLLDCDGIAIAGGSQIASCGDLNTEAVARAQADNALVTAIDTKQDSLLGCDGEVLAGGLNIPTCQEMATADAALSTSIDTKQDSLLDCAGDALVAGSQVAQCSELAAVSTLVSANEQQHVDSLVLIGANQTAIAANQTAIATKQDALTDCDGADLVAGTAMVTCAGFDDQLTAALADDETCYDLPDLGDTCNITKVAFAEDANGCGKLYKYTKDPIPSGQQFLARGVEGTEVTQMTEAGTWDGEYMWGYGNFDIDHTQHKVFEACVTFTKEDFCTLGITGQTIQIAADVRLGYYFGTTDIDNIPLQDYGTQRLSPYQVGSELQVNGQMVAVNTDAYALNTDGRNHHTTDLIAGDWDTDGEDMVVCVKVYVVRERTPAGNLTGSDDDTFELDMAQISVQMNLK